MLIVLGAPANPTHFTQCVADQHTDYLSLDEIDACIAASGFGFGYHLCVAAFVVILGCGLWALFRRGRTAGRVEVLTIR